MCVIVSVCASVIDITSNPVLLLLLYTVQWYIYSTINILYTVCIVECICVVLLYTKINVQIVCVCVCCMYRIGCVCRWIVCLCVFLSHLKKCITINGSIAACTQHTCTSGLYCAPIYNSPYTWYIYLYILYSVPCTYIHVHCTYSLTICTET